MSRDGAAPDGAPVDALRHVLLVVEPDPATDPAETERSTRQLIAELGDLDVDSVVAVPAGQPPESAKAGDPCTLGALLVTLGATGGVLTVLVHTVRDWLARQAAARRISVTIKGDTLILERASEQERKDVIDAYLRRHEGG